MKWKYYDRLKSQGFAKCALIQTWPAATLRASSLCASGSVPMTGNNGASAMSLVASPASSREGNSADEMRVAANHKQGLETSLSTCTEPWLQGSIATLENQLVGFLPHTKPNRRPIVCADRFPDLSGQIAANLKPANERHPMRCAGGVHGAI